MTEISIVPAGTHERLEREARIIAGTHFVIERLTGGAWAELARIADLKPTYPVPPLFAERHYGTQELRP